MPDGVADPSSNRELTGADQLISDLAALLDAGLVVVDEHVLGPARYSVAPVAGSHNERRNGRTLELRRHHARLT
jgi:hypothetical protein